MDSKLWAVTTICLTTLSLPCILADLLSSETLGRRRLTRFQPSHPDSQQCWDRHGVDGFYSPVDAHNHFRPFGGPPVPWDTYTGWMRDHGIIFSTMFGIGQQILPKDPSSPACCYYLHCASPEYPVVPDSKNDYLNAQDYNQRYKDQPLAQQMHLTLSATFPNLQHLDEDNSTLTLRQLEKQFPDSFQWSGEINVFKHALAANGFFLNGRRVTEDVINSGRLDSYFFLMEQKVWPVTLHCDLGCDNYHSVSPYFKGSGPFPECIVPPEELELAKQNYSWWQDFLGDYYRGFFNAKNSPKPNFKKIQHLKVWDTLLSRFPKMTVVWAHLGLSKELKYLHPTIHVYIIQKLFSRHRNLLADVSWDVLSRQLLMKHDPRSRNSLRELSQENHVDFKDIPTSMLDIAFLAKQRDTLEAIWDQHKVRVRETGTVSGPTYAMVIYLEMFHTWSDRFLTGTDFVSSQAPAEMFPGQKDPARARGCMKDKANHARQVTDTSSINMFLSDEAFSKIVLGGNYFRILRLESQFAPPPVCGDTALPSPGLPPGRSHPDPVSSHVLDTSQGHPASNVSITLSQFCNETLVWQKVLSRRTDKDGRASNFLSWDQFMPGNYKMKFATGDYFRNSGTEYFYPFAEVVFQVKDASQHFHVPLLLNPFGYTTYRGT